MAFLWEIFWVKNISISQVRVITATGELVCKYYNIGCHLTSSSDTSTHDEVFSILVSPNCSMVMGLASIAS